ncbi:berberine bridge enzyme-like 22 [Cicer arietinum]|uniref:Berberine bridge enzyme-like 22 n=1 Tax=Cicer arietinum TaxID=3827 RepID=A0A1S2Y6S2_CICAR|nr:berberine bridge enzyme-like 22 [Cicer arietinum]
MHVCKMHGLNQPQGRKEKHKRDMNYLVVFMILSLSISYAASTSLDKSFMQCMLTIIGDYSKNIEKTVFNSSSLLYPKVLESLEQNPRWLNSSNKPLLIVKPFHESEIQAAILCSKEIGVQIRVRSGGHDYEGLSYLCKTPFIMIDLIEIRSIKINLVDETAWIQAGATLGELYYKISKASKVHGFPAGLCASVGIGGHISGGGFGTLLRKYGLAADHVVDAYLIDANGRILDRKSMGEDVFWAIRGGSASSFGVVLAWKIRLVKVPSIVTVFSVRTVEERAKKLFHRWQYIADKLHEDLFIRVVAQNDGSNSKQIIQAFFNSLFLGGKDKLIPIMNESFPELGLQAKDCIEMSWIQSVLYFAGYNNWDPPEFLLNRTTIYKSSFKAKSDYVKEPISETSLEGVWTMLLKEDTLALLIMDPYGGKMSEISESEIPFPHREGYLYNIQYMVKWEVNTIDESNKNLKWMEMVYRYMTPYVSKSPRAAYFNYRDLDLGSNKHDNNTSYSEASVWGSKYFKGNFRRLAKIKTKFDPQNFFRNEQSIPLLNI